MQRLRRQTLGLRAYSFDLRHGLHSGHEPSVAKIARVCLPAVAVRNTLMHQDQFGDLICASSSSRVARIFTLHTPGVGLTDPDAQPAEAEIHVTPPQRAQLPDPNPYIREGGKDRMTVDMLLPTSVRSRQRRK